MRLGHEEAIRKLEERIQSKLVLASANRDTELMKKLETLREHVSGNLSLKCVIPWYSLRLKSSRVIVEGFLLM